MALIPVFMSVFRFYERMDREAKRSVQSCLATDEHR
jgi:hypothetical protein